MEDIQMSQPTKPIPHPQLTNSQKQVIVAWTCRQADYLDVPPLQATPGTHLEIQLIGEIERGTDTTVTVTISKEDAIRVVEASAAYSMADLGATVADALRFIGSPRVRITTSTLTRTKRRNETCRSVQQLLLADTDLAMGIFNQVVDHLVDLEWGGVDLVRRILIFCKIPADQKLLDDIAAIGRKRCKAVKPEDLPTRVC
jgi:hypothetical protein